jgi:hypothetical protein
MQDASHSVNSDEVYGLVAHALAQLDEPAGVRDDGVWLLRWPSVRISMDRAMAFRSAPESEAWTAWVDLTCMYNTTLPFTAARTHVIGLGNGRAEAIADAVETWRKGVAPALLSYIHGFLKADADTWPAGDERAPPGWSCINGPYVLRGDPTSVKALASFLQRQPMVGPVREHLAAALDAGAPFHTVSLYRAQMASGPFADVLIDNQPDIAAGELLKRMSWPEQLAGAQFIAARHFLLCVAPSAPADSGPATDHPQEKARNPRGAILASALFMFLAAAFSYALHEMFVSYAARLARAAGEANYTLVPASPFWFVPASVLGVLFAAAVMLAATLQKNRGDKQAPAHGLSAIPWRLVAGGMVIAAFMVLLAYFAAHSRLQLTADEIVLRRLWSFETERYPYSHVSALTEDGEPGGRGGTFSIHLKDAPVWSTRQEVIFPGAAEKQYLATRTGLEIRRSPKP